MLSWIPATIRRPGSAIGVATLAVCIAPAPLVEAQDPAKSQPGQVHEHVAVPGTLLTPTRESSGTSWLPDDTPMFGVHRPWRGWDLRVDGSAFGVLLVEPGDRHRTGGPGEQQFALANWGMATARRGLGRGRIGVRVMLSAEPVTIPGCGSLSYLATGEVCEGTPPDEGTRPSDREHPREPGDISHRLLCQRDECPFPVLGVLTVSELDQRLQHTGVTLEVEVREWMRAFDGSSTGFGGSESVLTTPGPDSAKRLRAE